MNEVKAINSSDASKIKTIVYWIATGIIVLQSLIGAALDLSGNPGFIKVFSLLGYPQYLMIILGVWRILGAIALVIPRFPTLKEWAYAGLIFDLTGAAASHIFVGDVRGAVFPLIFAAVTFTSWALRPSSRKLSDQRAVRTKEKAAHMEETTYA